MLNRVNQNCFQNKVNQSAVPVESEAPQKKFEIKKSLKAPKNPLSVKKILVTGVVTALALPKAVAATPSQLVVVNFMVPMYDARLGKDYSWCFKDPLFRAQAQNLCVSQAASYGGDCLSVGSAGFTQPMGNSALMLNFYTMQTRPPRPM
jgi:hypothetical protein